MARALVTLMEREGLTQVVDLGCGRGELLTEVHRLAPTAACLGVDVVPRPAGLAEPVGWLESPGGASLPAGLHDLRHVLVIANEWLDVVPCTVAEVDEAGELREVLVDPHTGAERLGGELDGADLLWCERHWPPDAAAPGDRVEVGRARDEAWADLVGRIHSGVAVAVDYGHCAGDRPAAGTLTGFRDGRQVLPLPDGSCDLTAHVAMDSLPHDELLDQRTALRRLGTSGATPPRELALADPTAYLHALGEASAAAALTARGGLGDFLWAVTRVRP
jgi:SAM-dependent MidA family methyltransferase